MLATYKSLIITIMIAISALSFANTQQASTQLLTTDTLSESEIDSMLWIAEEEKLASNVYLKLYELWGLQPFYNIGAKSEVQHTQTMASLLASYSIENSISQEPGVFSNPELQALYNTLVEQGSQSLEAALYVGAAIEELDIVDLQNAIAQSSQSASIAVYEELMRGSRNHLRAFMRQIEQRGFNYSPQYLDPELFNAIKDSPQEQGQH